MSPFPRYRSILPLAGFAVALVLAAPFGMAEEGLRVGTIKTLRGEARVLGSGAARAAAIGGAVHQDDTIETGKDGALGLTFIDDTTLSLGPNSRIRLSKVVFDPDKGNFAFLADIARGTFMFVSGAIAKLAPQSEKITTPVGTIGIRGTRFLVRIDE
ncbi:MAG TPA: FecR domain-containing protein [Stellaceae bacterium]|nr:FecR domain-containing protein [Stellaceae bacterium]